ncbi:hypothetical protein AC1031_007877 [Aphanomyces cochlioides]|nr:hypothetical protein AC1031_007877 [Aphanomyces cochlioides]
MEKLDYNWKPRLFMGDANKAQYRGLMDVVAPNTPDAQYLMCLFHVIKKCFEKKGGLTWPEWSTVSFDIYLLHMSTSYEDLLEKMSRVYHSDSGSALTNNPNEHFNAELKRFVNNQKLHVPHLIQEVCHLLAKESRARMPWATEAIVSIRLKRHFQKLQAQRYCKFLPWCRKIR